MSLTTSVAAVFLSSLNGIPLDDSDVAIQGIQISRSRRLDVGDDRVVKKSLGQLSQSHEGRKLNPIMIVDRQF